MIDIVRYREMLAELQGAVNMKSDVKIAGAVVAVSDSHLIKKLKDKEGLVLCANYPNAEMKGDEDHRSENNRVLLFLLEKVAAGRETDEEEVQHYARMQGVMALLKGELRTMEFACEEISPADGMLTEWEFDVFGGYNGLSVGFILKDYD